MAANFLYAAYPQPTCRQSASVSPDSVSRLSRQEDADSDLEILEWYLDLDAEVELRPPWPKRYWSFLRNLCKQQPAMKGPQFKLGSKQ
ncbi:hypothetical protein E4U30_001161 [Claviceps sp. LM220 group G6]|nr:hypothetical protein E4U30_001161 [Claviceps sp. LM220 group G6]